MDAVSLSGPLLPAFRPLQDNGGDGCCLLVWVYTTSFQTLLDIGGDGCCLLVWAFTTCSRGLLQDNEGDICCSPCLGLYYQLSDLAGCRGGRLPSPCLGLLIPARGAFCRIMREMFAVSLSGSSTTSFQTFAG